MPILSSLLAGAIVAGASVTSARAGGTRVLEIRERDDFDEGEFDGATLSSAGVVTQGYGTAARRIEKAGGTFVCRADGKRVLVGTSQPAAVFEAVPARRGEGPPKLRSLATLPGVVTSAVVPLGDGSLLAASLPGGTIHRIDRKGRVRPFAKVAADFVWDLAVVGDRVYAATGPSGKLFAMSKSGKDVEVVLDSEEEHLLSLAVVGDRLAIGTSPGAKLLTMGESSEGIVLRDFDGDELRALVLVGRTLVAAVNDFDDKSVGTADVLEKAVARASLAGTDAAGLMNLTKKGREATVKVFAVDLGRRRDVDRAEEAPWTRWFELDGGYGTDLAPDAAGRGVLLSTSKDGKVYRIEGPRESATAADLEQAVVTAVCRVDRGNVLATTTGAAAVVRLFTGPAMKGRYVSHVLDAKQPARFGTLLLEGRGPFRARVRTGPSEEPDARWTVWQDVPLRAVPDGLSGSLTGIGRRRFVQVEVGLAGPAARLSGVRIFHAPENLPPLVKSIEVTLPEPDEDDEPADPEAKIRWKADARDDDELVYRVYARKVGAPEGAWLRLDDPSKPLSKTSFTWKLDTVPDGVYEVRVVASDEPSNGTAFARHDALVSDPVVVDRGRPEVVGVDRKGRALTVRVRDAASRIARVLYRVDDGPLRTAAPVDGIADDFDERFRLLLPGALSPGWHRLQIYVHDAAGNLAVHAEPVEVR